MINPLLLLNILTFNTPYYFSTSFIPNKITRDQNITTYFTSLLLLAAISGASSSTGKHPPLPIPLKSFNPILPTGNTSADKANLIFDSDIQRRCFLRIFAMNLWRKIIQNRNIIILVHQFASYIRSDKTRSACDQYFFHNIMHILFDKHTLVIRFIPTLPLRIVSFYHPGWSTYYHAIIRECPTDDRIGPHDALLAQHSPCLNHYSCSDKTILSDGCLLNQQRLPKYMLPYFTVFMVYIGNHHICRYCSVTSNNQPHSRTSNMEILTNRYIILDSYFPPIVRLEPTMRKDTDIPAYRDISPSQNENRSGHIRPPSYATEPQP